MMYIKALRDLECGTLLNSIKHDLAKSGGYMAICSSILKRLGTIFNHDSVVEVVANLDLTGEGREPLEMKNKVFRD